MTTLRAPGSVKEDKEGEGNRSRVYKRITYGSILLSKQILMTSFSKTKHTLGEGEADADQTLEYHLLKLCGNKLRGCLALGRG